MLGPDPPSSNADLLGGGSTPPSSNADLLGGGSTPPQQQQGLAGGGVWGVLIWAPPPGSEVRVPPDEYGHIAFYGCPVIARKVRL